MEANALRNERHWQLGDGIVYLNFVYAVSFRIALADFNSEKGRTRPKSNLNMLNEISKHYDTRTCRLRIMLCLIFRNFHTEFLSENLQNVN